MACRLPGGATELEEYWRAAGASVSTRSREVPAERWDVDAYYDPDPDAPGKMSTRFGGFLDDVDRFDAHFFGISPREAVSMDPQQRLLLEVAWEALEHAGLSRRPPCRSTDRRVRRHLQRRLLPAADGARRRARSTRTSLRAPRHSIAAGRVSYVLGLHGPSVLDRHRVLVVAGRGAPAPARACARANASAALAGGVNLMLAPEVTIALSKARMMAPDGRCKTFDARADGFVRGEGCGIVVLKRLSDARADGDRILAVVRGTAVEPGRPQQRPDRAERRRAGSGDPRRARERRASNPAQVAYVEAHGTGTSLGDPIEVRALARRARRGTRPSAPAAARLGEDKHRASRSRGRRRRRSSRWCWRCGTARYPPHPLLDKLNPHIEWERLPVSIPTATIAWPAASGPRRAGVSSFGFSGTNAHLILEEAEADAPAPPPAATAVARVPQLVPLSAKTAPALTALLARYASHLESPAGASLALADIAHTTAAGRAHFHHRAAVVAADAGQLRQRLADGTGVVRGVVAEGYVPEIGFLFTGQGAQRIGMGRELYDSHPLVRRLLDECQRLLSARLPRPLLEVMFGGDQAALDDTTYAQPALFALEYALAALWRSLGVVPAVLLGHSVGELAAACVASVMSLEDGLELVAERGRLMGQLPRDGAMAAIFTGAVDVAAAVSSQQGRIAIAAHNGPRHVVVSGDTAAVAALVARMEAAGVKTRALQVSHAFHSPLMEPMLPAFTVAAGGKAFHTPQIRLVANVTGELMTEAPDAAYWTRHVRAAVQFERAVAAARGLGIDTWIEIGPAPVLLALGRACLAEERGRWLPSLQPGRGDWQQFLDSAAALYAAGADLDWERFARERGGTGSRVALPSYPFQRQHFWIEQARRAPAAAAQPFADWLYDVDWEPLPRAGEAAAAFATGPLVTSAAAEVPALAERFAVSAYDTFQPGLNAMCTAYVLQGLAELGWSPRAGDAVAAAPLMQQLGIAGRHARLVERMLQMLGEDGVLSRSDGGWRAAAAPPPRADAAALAQQLFERFEAHRAELVLTRRCAEQLAGVLRGAVDPLQLLFPGGSLSEAEDLYQNAPSSRFYNTLVQTILGQAVAGRTAGERLRILEIGGGTGGTTSYVLPHLPAGQTEYTFTDVSAHFLRQAQRKFAAFPFARYRTLDIGTAPEAQGFAAGEFDIVIAANVLHATADLRRTLAHVRELLAPGGLMVLLEGTAPQRFGDLTVGLTEGWWSFTDTDLRDYALLPQARWFSLLAEAGFTDAVATPQGAQATGLLSQQSVFLARRPAALAAAARPDHWLILADEGGIGAAVAAGLDVDATLVRRGVPYQAADGTRLDLGAPAGLRALVADVGAARRPAHLGVLHLWAADPLAGDDPTAEQVAQAQARGTASALHLVQALAAVAPAPRTELWLATRGAQPAADGERVAVEQSSLWGLGSVVALELPELSCSRLDLAPQETAAHAAGALLEELRLGRGDEDQVACRGGRRYARRLRRVAAPSRQARTAFRADATYLITGGLSGLGLLTAEWLVAHGARSLTLVSRRGASQQSAAALARMAAAGARVDVHALDVAETAGVAALVAGIERTGPPLGGVFHCAGVLDDGMIVHQDWQRFRTVMAAKVDGAWNLHRCTRHLPLEHFVLFSSGGSLLGTMGQSNHAAANAFLDALAHDRRASGLPALSINWGAWADVGSVVSHGVGARVAVQGLGLIPVAAGLDILDRLLGDSRPQVAVVPVDWPTLIRQFPAGRVPAFLKRLAGEAPAAAPASAAPLAQTAAPPPAQRPLRERLAAAPSGERRTLLNEHIRREVGLVLGLDGADLDEAQPLQQLGLDSLMAVELRNHLSDSTEHQLPITLLFDQPSVGALTGFLGRALALDAEAAPPAPPAAARPQVRGANAAASIDLDDLSEDALARLLAEKLKQA